MNRLDERKENIRYALLISVHTMLTCPSFNFIAYYLLGEHVDNSDVGIIIAVSCLLAVLLQQLVSRLVDAGNINGRKLLLALSMVEIIGGVATTIVDSAAMKSLMFGTLLCVTLVMLPVLNSFSFLYQSRNITVNYGVARGCGSLSYSGISIVLGFLTAALGLNVVPLSYTVLGSILFAILLTMPDLKATKNPRGGSSGGSLRLSKYPEFALMLVGLSMVMFFHNMSMTYFIHVINHVGGDSSHMGMALGIAAFVEIPALFLYTRIKGRTPSKIFLAISGAAFFVKAALFVAADSITMIYCVQLVQCLAYGLMAASRVYYVDEVVGKEHETTGQAYIAATETIGLVLGSVVGGVVMQVSDVVVLLWVGAVAALIGMGCMIMSATGLKNMPRLKNF
ncbi:MAG: MFS transporter [Selenomonadaceae bacterium]|nr:MFS transporter [Selenomonadaceae bacterium]